MYNNNVHKVIVEGTEVFKFIFIENLLRADI